MKAGDLGHLDGDTASVWRNNGAAQGAGMHSILFSVFVLASTIFVRAQGPCTEGSSKKAQRPRYHMHYTPTYSSWVNQVERWFGLITQRAIRRGSFTSVPDLVRKIDTFVQHYNRSSRPFVRTATADSILQKIA